ncbi:MAG: hypothetical protein IJ757_05980 [Clostridiales bacterium]|nr:hypothetical protein [Clostridiales bacterium]
MSFIAFLLFVYSVAITIALIITSKNRNTLYNKTLYLEKKLKELEKEKLQSQEPEAPQQLEAPQQPSQVQQPVYAQAPVQTQASNPGYYSPAPSYAKSDTTLPTYTKVAPASKKSQGLGAVGVSFAVGVLLMVIAAAVFISATWQTMPAGGKCVVLAIVVAVVYGLCAFSRKKLKLNKTSSVLYMLGSLITPLAIAVGFLAFDSQETSIMLACCGLSLGITGYLGYRIFRSTYQVGISYFGFVWMELFLCMEAIGSFEGFVFGICFAALVSGLIHFLKPELKFFGIFAEVTAYCAVIGLLMSAAIKPRLMAWSIISQVIYFASLILLTKRRKFVRYLSALAPLYTLIVLWAADYVSDRSVYAIIYICLAAGLLALYKYLKHDNPVSNAVISIGMGLVSYIVAMGGETKDFCYYVGLIAPVLSFIAVILMSRSKLEKPFYYYLIALGLLILGEELFASVVPVYVFLGITAAAMLIPFKFKNIHITIASSAAFIISLITALIEEEDFYVYTIITAVIITALYGAVVFIGRMKDSDKKAYTAARFTSLAMLIVTNLSLMVYVLDRGGASLVAIIVIDIIMAAITLFDRDNYFSLLPCGTFMISVLYQLLNNTDVNTTLVGAIFIVAFVAIGRLFFCERIIRKNRIDYLTFLAGLICFITGDGKLFQIILLLTLYTMTFIGRFSDADSVEEKVKSQLRVILSTALGLLAISFTVVDFEYSSVCDFEIRMLFLLIAAFVIYMVIRPGAAARWIWFSTVAFAIECEAIRAMSNGYLLALTLVSVCVCGIFIYSFIAKRRSWFILSITNIGLIGIMFAITFWDSKLWWIYLLVLGAILIGTASLNEYRRRRAIEEGLQDKKIRLFDSWKW